jgi:hypothetical protein
VREDLPPRRYACFTSSYMTIPSRSIDERPSPWQLLIFGIDDHHTSIALSHTLTPHYPLISEHHIPPRHSLDHQQAQTRLVTFPSLLPLAIRSPP